MRLTESQSHHDKNKYFSAYDDSIPFSSRLMSPDVIYGVFTPFGKLDAAEICECDNPGVTAKVRKVMKTHVAWDDSMEDLTSSQFKAFKTEMEEKVKSNLNMKTGTVK